MRGGDNGYYEKVSEKDSAYCEIRMTEKCRDLGWKRRKNREQHHQKHGE